MPGAATSSRRRAPLAVAVLLALASGSAAAVAAQSGESRTASSAAPAASLSGAVVDAATGEPVAGATVVLEPESAGAFPGTASGGSFLTTARTAGTDGRGRYRFEGLAPGPYQLYVMRIGYRPFSVGVDLGREPGRVSIGLEADPIALEPLRGETRGGGPYVAGDPFADDPALGRLLAAELRRRRFLTTDVRELTHADVVEGVTLGEPDVLRALQRLPGVTTRSDYTAELWTRGAPWDQTRVYFDGIPVFNPLHALGVLSGISSSAVGTVWFYPGVRPASIGEGAAGVIDLRSRPATGTGELNLQADVSLMTAGLAMDQRVLDGRAGWMLSGRRSYLDWLSRLASRATDSDASFPYGFTEVAGQVDLRVGSRHTIEGSWLWEGDELTEGDTGAPLRATWGNALGRVSWTVDLGPVSVQHTVGGSSHRGRIGLPTVSAAEDLAGAIREPLGESLVQWAGIRGTLWPEARSLAGPEWSVGYALELHHSDYFGPQPLPVPRYALADRVVSEAGEPISYSTIYSRWSDGLMVASLWGERTWTLADRLSLRTGLRIETGEEVRESEPVRVAPRLSLRYSPLPELALSVGAARVHQYAQAVSPTGIHLASLVATDAWVVAGSGIPAVTADHGTAGFEAWVAPGRVFTLNGFARRTTGVALPDPAPGPVFGENRLLVAGETVAYGLEASVRQLTGPVTGSASYSLSRSRTDAAGRSFPSGADRTHVLNATAMTLPLPGLRVGAAFTAATGVPFTRTVSTAEECADLPGCDPGHLPWAGSPNGLRAPTFASLDLLVDWSTEVRGLHLGIYGQIRNVLGRENATIYTGTGGHCLLIGCSVDELRNAYERGVPRLPVVGIRVRR